ncbi:hypothetical protein [Azospirillum picis]|uniref:Uncharacterized protein n=1 Tax=Azospirillum picis TaxID=488438 RepID=A0ABU0MFN4_9PROT|nr:hypothetical protein [Azospirillum picis]MBP2298694.1 hypothetical protein [Azospirillum picis]MDQ0532257.1 hypothetical protein [Azospirillum picis]
MDGGCGGGACGGGKRGGGPPGGGRPGFRYTMRMAMAVNALLGALLVSAAGATQAVTLWAAALLVLNHAVAHAVTMLATGGAPEWRARLPALHGMALAVAAIAVVVVAGRAIATLAMPDVPLASLALLLAMAVGVAASTLLFAGRRGTLTLRTVWLCSRRDLVPLAAGLAGLGGSWLLLDGWPDALAGAAMAASLLPPAWGLLRGPLGLSSQASGRAPR